MVHPAISLWELKAVRAFMRAQGRTEADEDAIFKALDEMRRIEQAAVRDTAKARRSESSRRAAMRRRDSPQPQQAHKEAEHVVAKNDEALIAPFDPGSGPIEPYDEIERY